MFNMPFNTCHFMHLTAPVKKVGNSLAIFIPADKAREARIREGDVIEADLEHQEASCFGRYPNLTSWSVADKRDMWPDEDL